MSEEIHRLEESLNQCREEKGKVEWTLGEHKQWLGDARWRLGELDSDVRNRTQQLDEAHMRIGGLERRIWELEDQARQSGHGGHNLAHLVEELKEQKGKVEWRLGELTQSWNDAKWR